MTRAPKKNVPRRLTDRDQRNLMHIIAAHAVIQQTAKMIVTKTALREVRTAIELSAISDRAIRSLQGLPVRNKVPQNATVICSFFWLDEGLQMADNFLGRCADCQAPIQFRPEVKAAIKATKLCVFCGADRCLQAYWAEQNKLDRAGKRGAPKSPS
jgi:hypothetical protein